MSDEDQKPLGDKLLVMSPRKINEQAVKNRTAHPEVEVTELDFNGLDPLIRHQRRFTEWSIRHRSPYTDLIEPLINVVGFEVVETMLKRLEQKIDAARQLDDDGAAFKDITEKADDILAQLNELAKKE